MDEKKFCMKCGTELEGAATFCPRCGERVAPQAPQAAQEPTPIQQYNMNIKPKIKITDKIDFKRTVLSNIIPVACLAIGIILVIVGMGIRIPSDYISSYSMTEYVGGDAYNFIIESGIRGGQIAGAEITKGLYIAVGLLIACVSAMKVNIVKPEKDDNK